MSSQIDPAVAECNAIIAANSKSFHLASRLLPEDVRQRAVVIYAWCRRVDDAIDECPPGTEQEALARLHDELNAVYAEPGDSQGESQVDIDHDVILRAFRSVVRERRIPRQYPADLLEGMRWDVEGRRYRTIETLYHYCYCVAGTVGLMMSHVMGVRRESALRNATHLGMAMQLTNICRDVVEDWQRGRLYLPESWLAEVGEPDLAERL
ncbi:MAG: phytoene/squalene synthase family protein, partial [Myxococcales bacterium]|nr:phytoene/squalene synthase family protein [Myxococcales bacterium]